MGPLTRTTALAPARGRARRLGGDRLSASWWGTAQAATDVAGTVLVMSFPIMAFVALGLDLVVAPVVSLPAAVVAGVHEPAPAPEPVGAR